MKNKDNVVAGQIPTNSLPNSKPFNTWYSFKDESELVLFTFVVPNFICYTFSRGIHIQFLLWISFSLPYLFAKCAGFGWKTSIVAYMLIDWCHSWVANVIQPMFLIESLQALFRGEVGVSLQIIRFKVFSQLRSITIEEVLKSNSPPVQILGAYYPHGFSIYVIPASFVLFMLEILVLQRIYQRCNKNLEKIQVTSNSKKEKKKR